METIGALVETIEHRWRQLEHLWRQLEHWSTRSRPKVPKSLYSLPEYYYLWLIIEVRVLAQY